MKKSYLYHYTNLEGLNGILQEDNICFWGTRYDQMNDPSDYIFALDIVLPRIKEMIKEKQQEGKFANIIDRKIDPYIVSFSEKRDDLNIWRFYHSSVCLIFDKERLIEECEKNKYLYSHCEYCSENKEEIKEALINLNKYIPKHKDNQVLDNLKELFGFIKYKNYEIEDEFRIIQYDISTEDIEINKTNKKYTARGVKVKCIRNNDLILYKEFKFPKDILKGLIIHEQNKTKFENFQKHLELVLRSRRYNIKKEDIRITETRYNK